MYVCVPCEEYVHMRTGVQGGEKRALDLLGLQLQNFELPHMCAES